MRPRTSDLTCGEEEEEEDERRAGGGAAMDHRRGYLISSRPLEYPVPAFVPTAAYAGVEREGVGRQQEPQRQEQQEVVDSATLGEVGSAQPPIPAAPEAESAARPTTRSTMTFTLKGLSRNGKRAIYTGAAQSFHVPVGAFIDKSPPTSIEVPDGVFAGPTVRQPRAKLTVEERKAARAARPKPTLAELIERRRRALAALEAKAAAAERPSL